MAHQWGFRIVSKGDCPRCASDIPSGQGTDTCLCVLAEQNAIAFAARHGARTEDAILFTTTRYCFGCLKELIQAGISRIWFVEPYDYESDLEEVYQQLLKESGLDLVVLDMDS